jgi:HD-GYP domain-containing protein (c-di-GMP phosphodiesterase class II)
MNELNVSSLSPGDNFNQPVFLDDQYVLLSPETPVSQALIERLVRWNFDTVRSSGTEVDTPSAARPAETDAQVVATLEQDMKENTMIRETDVFVHDLLEYTERVFTNFVTRNELSQQQITDRVKDLIEDVRTRRKYILRIPEMRGEDKNYIVVHSVKTTILSLAIGLTLKLPPHRLIDLGTAALTHEIGMIRLPPQYYMAERTLTPQEKKAITAHTILGFKILKSFSFPMSVCLAVLESHEAMNGSGYPRGLTGEKISLYAKIILACGSYAALTSARPYRKAQEPHTSILDLLKLRGTQYDEVVLRALVKILSVYPLGSFVQLANGTRGMVVEVNDEDPRSPRVKVIMSAVGERYSEFPIVQTTDREHQITRPLTDNELRLIRSYSDASRTESELQ